jgi:hypothetical protein
MKLAIFIEDLQRMLPTNVGLFGKVVSEEKIV